MCIVCQRSLSLHDLRSIAPDVYVCASARWCLISTLHTASNAQIAEMHARASDLALRAAQTVSIRGGGGRKKTQSVVPSGLPDFVRLS